ncbi:MAG TPA: Shedu anti-phage system protein SduA domain-containing protein [Isosphaeraceae bacterium]|nr:Shedu anti-phage system protein SduA domain-containing protein [Isosphaeraceae bacterium]
MKEFIPIAIDLAQCRAELDRFQSLLDSKQELSERHDLQLLFRECRQLTALIGGGIPRMRVANRLAYEFPVFGDYVAEIVIGHFERKCYCAIELEDARHNSIFNQLEGRATPEWGRRLEHGFGQLVDWFFSFDDHRNTAGFARHFDFGHVEFSGMLVIGRSGDLSDHDRTRLRWRSNRVTINTHRISCLTYDELYDDLNDHWRVWSQVGQR